MTTRASSVSTTRSRRASKSGRPRRWPSYKEAKLLAISPTTATRLLPRTTTSVPARLSMAALSWSSTSRARALLGASCSICRPIRRRKATWSSNSPQSRTCCKRGCSVKDEHRLRSCHLTVGEWDHEESLSIQGSRRSARPRHCCQGHFAHLLLPDPQDRVLKSCNPFPSRVVQRTVGQSQDLCGQGGILSHRQDESLNHALAIVR